jgi:ketosteroid isomerase-like protein
MERERTSEVLETFQRYTRAFQALDARAVARFFDEPALMITPDRVIALPTGAAVEQAYGRVMAELPRVGYERTDFSSIGVRRLSDDLAIVSGSGVWVKTSGERFAPFGMTYMLRRSGDDWRIVVATIHDPDAPPATKR